MNNDEKIDLLLVHAVDTNERLDNIDSNLSEHMKRTEAAENRLEILEEDIRPVLEHFKGIKWAFSALVGLSVILKVLEFFKN
jgi:hypothetical protein